MSMKSMKSHKPEAASMKAKHTLQIIGETAASKQQPKGKQTTEKKTRKKSVAKAEKATKIAPIVNAMMMSEVPTQASTIAPTKKRINAPLPSNQELNGRSSRSKSRVHKRNVDVDMEENEVVEKKSESKKRKIEGKNSFHLFKLEISTGDVVSPAKISTKRRKLNPSVIEEEKIQLPTSNNASSLEATITPMKSVTKS